MRSPVQIWLSAPRRTTSIQDVVFLRFDIDKAQTGCYATSAWAVICARLLKGLRLFVGFACCLQNNDRFVPKPLRFKCLMHFAIVLRPLRTPPERPSAFRRLCLPSSSPKSPDGYCYAIFALTVKLWLAVPYARRKNASAFSA